VGLKDLNIKFKYDSDKDNIISDFYNPVLSNSKKYYRLSGFFSSTVLAVVARGLENFIKNDGKMYLICSAMLSEKDMQIIKESIESPTKIIEKSLINSLDDINDEFTKDHVAALGWMLTNDKLEIKIAILKDDSGIFHQKIGILEDEYGTAISFSGSNNETANGLIHNIENFKVFKKWKIGQNEYFNQDYDSFFNYWNNSTKRTIVIELPDAIVKKIINIAPKNIDEINLNKYDNNLSNPADLKNNYGNEIIFRDYQNEAISNWLNNGKRGIFEMATGTGKTITALGCCKKINLAENKLVFVIICPQIHLIDQWKDNIKKFFDEKIIIASSQNTKWKAQLKDTINNFVLDIEKKAFILTTHKTASSDNFLNLIYKFKCSIMVIIDEVHGIGSSKQDKALDNKYNYRLGLSATPSRYFDEIGTENIKEYFGGIVFKFSLTNALNTINPITGTYYLTPYIYHPMLVDLTDEEYGEYVSLSIKIANILNYNKKKSENKKLKLLCFKRTNILNNAVAKYKKLEEILDNNKDISYLIVFCSPEQIDNVQKIFNKKGIRQHKFTNVEKVTKEEKYGNLTEREYLIKKFESKEYRALIAMKCLDEGVDIPSAKNAIIMSSTSNPKEHVQRRGRILRHFPEKNQANIYDILVFPEDNTTFNTKIIKKEAERYEEFAINAINSIECKKILKKYL
jgi:superfamily II DNA or RNA helicase